MDYMGDAQYLDVDDDDDDDLPLLSKSPGILKVWEKINKCFTERGNHYYEHLDKQTTAVISWESAVNSPQFGLSAASRSVAVALRPSISSVCECMC